MKLNMPPVGKCKIEDSPCCALVEWSPGNMTKYEVIVTDLPQNIRDVIGGDRMVSVCSLKKNRIYTSYAATENGIMHGSHIVEKFGDIGSEQDIMMITALLNWILYDDDYCREYAQEVWDEAQERWKIARPVS